MNRILAPYTVFGVRQVLLNLNKVMRSRVVDKCNPSNLTEKQLTLSCHILYTLITPMGSSHPDFSGVTAVNTERDFPAV